MATTIVTQLHELPDMKEAAQAASERKQDAKKHFEAIKKAGNLESISSMRIGWNIYYLRANNLWGMLGFSTESEAQLASNVGRSTWYSTAGLAEAFNGLDEEQFTSMKLSNAQLLADLPESKRLSREWIRMAGSDSMDKFSIAIDKEMDGQARSSDGKERRTVLKMPMPTSRKTVIDNGLKEYAARIGMDTKDPETDTSRALELMIAERSGQTSLIEAITNTAQRLKAAKELQDSELSAEEILVKVYALVDEAILELAASLTAVQNLDAHAAATVQ